MAISGGLTCTTGDPLRPRTFAGGDAIPPVTVIPPCSCEPGGGQLQPVLVVCRGLSLTGCCGAQGGVVDWARGEVWVRGDTPCAGTNEEDPALDHVVPCCREGLETIPEDLDPTCGGGCSLMGTAPPLLGRLDQLNTRGYGPGTALGF